MHKLSTWQEQFGTSGCVGCGRCITWCPVGIDLTEEAGVVASAAGAGTTSAPRRRRASIDTRPPTPGPPAIEREEP
jgi:ferredoxin